MICHFSLLFVHRLRRAVTSHDRVSVYVCLCVYVCVCVCLSLAGVVTHPPFEHQNFDQYPLIASKPWELAKKVQLALIGSRSRAVQRAIDEPCTLPLSPPMGGTKRDFAIFASKFQLLSKNVCCKVSLCENFQQQSCSYIIPLSNGP